MTTQNSTTAKPAKASDKEARKVSRDEKRLIRIYEKLNWLGQKTIVVMLDIMAHGDDAVNDIEKIGDATEKLKYGEVTTGEYYEELASIWAVACGFKPRKNWPYYSE